MDRLEFKELYNATVALKKDGVLLQKDIEEQLAKQLNKGTRTIRRWVSELKMTFPIPHSTRKVWDDFIKVTGDAIAIYADLHCDFHDAGFIERAMEMQRKYNVTQAVVAGDLFDMMLYSSYIPDPESGLLPEANVVRTFMNNLDLISPDGVWVIEGNHEARIVRALKRGIGMRELLDMASVVDTVEVSDYRYMYWNNWYICHPDNFSNVPLSIARRFVAQKHCNVAVAHQHRDVWFNDGYYTGIELGMMADPLRLGYYQKASSLSGPFQQSFTILERWDNNEGYNIHKLYGKQR